MSMPSSRLLVATIAGLRPAFRSSSIWMRCSRATLPWWARTSSSPGQLVQALGETLAEAARVREDDRAPVLPDQLEDPRVDRRPDADPRLGSGGRASGLLVERKELAGLRHVLDRDDHLEVERLPAAGVDDRHVAVRSDAAQEPGDQLERSLGRAESRSAAVAVALALHDEPLEPLQAEREVGAALGAGDRVDLVDDHVLDAAEDVARLAGQHQVERLRGRDQDVRRAPRDGPAILGGRVAGPAGDRDVRSGVAEPGRGQSDPGQWSPEVALDVVGQGLERADVQDADAAGVLLRGRWRGAGWRPDGPASTGRPRASCRCRSGRGSACGGRPRSPPSPRTGPGSARRTSSRTRPGRPARRAPADRRSGPWRRALRGGVDTVATGLGSIGVGTDFDHPFEIVRGG